MIQAKYLIIIGVIVCLFVLYYFYDEISSVKKMFLPTYQKTMSLEAKVFELENKNNELLKKKSKNPIIDSPALSVTYQSDMCKNGNLSIKYADLTDTEANELLKNINQRSNQQTNNLPKFHNGTTISDSRQQIIPGSSWDPCIRAHDTHPYAKNSHNKPNFLTGNSPINNTNQIQRRNIIKTDEISDFKSQDNINSSYNLDKNRGIYVNNDIFDEVDIINVKMSDIMKKQTSNNIKTDNNSDQTKYNKILNDLDKNTSKIHSENFFDDDTELDPDIIRSISESIQHADMPSETILSDIPIVNRLKKSISKKGNNYKKTNKSK